MNYIKNIVMIVFYHCCIIIYKGDNDNIVKLIESSCDGNIRIWNFHSGELLKKLEIFKNKNFCYMVWLYGIMNLYLLDVVIEQ